MAIRYSSHRCGVAPRNCCPMRRMVGQLGLTCKWSHEESRTTVIGGISHAIPGYSSIIPRVTISLTNPVKFLRGVGPQRAATLEERGIKTVGDLLGYLPFRYEDRIRFTPIAEIIPGQAHTILVEVANAGGTIRFARGRGGVFHIAVRDGSGTLYARFFHGSYLEGKFKQG